MKENKKAEENGTTSIRVPKALLARLNALGEKLPLPPSGNQIAIAFLEAMASMAEGNELEVFRIFNAFEATRAPKTSTSSFSELLGTNAASKRAAAKVGLEVSGRTPPTDATSGGASRPSKGAGKE